MAKRGRQRVPFDVDAALGKATRLFLTHGYRGASIQDFVDGARISRARIYATFGGKLGLFLAVLKHEEQNHPLGRLAESARTGSPRQAILDTFDRIVEEALAGSPGCLMIDTVSERPQDAAVAGIAQRSFEKIEQNLRMAVEAGKAAGEIAMQVNAKLTSGALLSLLLGLHLLARSRPEPDVLRTVADQAAALLTSSE